MTATDSSTAAETPSNAPSQGPAQAPSQAPSQAPTVTPSVTPPERRAKLASSATPKAPGTNRLDQDSRRKLLGRIAPTATQRELREIQSEVINAYLGMVIRRTGADENVEQVRDAARARLKLLEPTDDAGE